MRRISSYMASISKHHYRHNTKAVSLIISGVGIAAAAWISFVRAKRTKQKDDGDVSSQTAHEQLIEGGTPLIKLRFVSKLIKRSIYVKMESMNPGGTGKDRAALNMIRVAEKEKKLPPAISVGGTYDDELFLQESSSVGKTCHCNTNEVTASMIEKDLESMILQAMESSRTGGLVVEGTSGSTGIALATLCASRGHACLVVLPDDQAIEKQLILRSLGAVVYEVPTASISNPKHYVNLGRKAAMIAREKYGFHAIFVDQFENMSNFDVHYHQTGPEILRQLNGRQLDAFVMSSGTGGTIAGIAKYLKKRNRHNNDTTIFRLLRQIIGIAFSVVKNNDSSKYGIEVVLVDPPGSVLYNKIEHGVAYTTEQRERHMRKHRYDTIAEGIGLDRVTRNFSSGVNFIDRAIRVTDQEAVDMAHWILQTEGLWVGSSSAMNLVGAIRTALSYPGECSVLTFICDGGQRHLTRFWDPQFIERWGLQWPAPNCIPECLQSALPSRRVYVHSSK